ncbi:MAG: hypothetical protein JNK77_16815 [Saprospiraceae bacterium]|nr:hypothetical protein [Saprospiraceae bacterium]
MKKYFLFGAYLILSLVIGEFHPFSRLPMYNSFPNYAYIFYLSDENERLIPYLKYFDYSKNASYIAFFFYSICTQHNYPYGTDQEDPDHLEKTGKEIMDIILKNEDTTPFDFDTLKLYRKNYYIHNNQIRYTDYLMYEKAISR